MVKQSPSSALEPRLESTGRKTRYGWQRRQPLQVSESVRYPNFCSGGRPCPPGRGHFFTTCAKALPRSFWHRGQALLALVLLLFAVGCTDSAGDRGSADDVDRRSRPLLIGTAVNFENVNELVAQGSAFNAAVLRQMFLWLADESLAPDNAGPTFHPRLARSWEFSEDRTDLTFTLRDDVFWSDGVPVTATDVRFTWQAQTSPEIAWSYADIKDGIENVEVLSETQVRFHFTRPTASAMATAIDGGILPSHVWSKLPFEQWREQPDWFGENLVTNGPYTLETWQPRQRLSLIASSNYYEPGVPKIERVIFVNIEEPAARMTQLLSGEIDALHGISPTSAQKIRDDPDLDLLTYPSRQFSFIFWNTERPMFDDARVRRALAHAIDREQMVKVLWGDLAVPHESLISSWHWAHSKLQPLQYNQELAKQLLDQAGWTRQANGTRQRNGVPFVFELTTNPGNQERWDAMRLIKEDLAAVGITVENRRIDFQQLSALNLAHDFDATLTALTMDTSLDFSYVLHSNAIDNGYNFGSFRNREVDQEIDAIGQVVDVQDALPHVAKIEQALRQEQPFLFLWEPKQLLAARHGLEVVTDLVSPFSNLQLWQWKQ